MPHSETICAIIYAATASVHVNKRPKDAADAKQPVTDHKCTHSTAEQAAALHDVI